MYILNINCKFNPNPEDFDLKIIPSSQLFFAFLARAFLPLHYVTLWILAHPFLKDISKFGKFWKFGAIVIPKILDVKLFNIMPSACGFHPGISYYSSTIDNTYNYTLTFIQLSVHNSFLLFEWKSRKQPPFPHNPSFCKLRAEVLKVLQIYINTTDTRQNYSKG